MAVVSDLMEEHIASERTCDAGHPLMLVAEGYAYCQEEPTSWWPWRLTPPHASWEGWSKSTVYGRDGEPIEAWLGAEHFSLERVLKFVQEDIDAHRDLPFDEDRERARLMPV